MLVRDLVSTCLRQIGVLAQSESPTSEDAEIGVTVLNDMLASWSIETLVNDALTVFNFEWPDQEPSVFIGPFSSVLVFPLTDILKFVYNGTILTRVTSVTGGTHCPLSYEFTRYSGDNFQIIMPAPMAAAPCQVVARINFQSSLTLDSDLGLPVHYNEAIRYNLAVRMASFFGISVGQELHIEAARLKRRIEELNDRRSLVIQPLPMNLSRR